MPYATRFALFGYAALEGERGLEWPERVPKIAEEGWLRFIERAPVDLARGRYGRPLSVAGSLHPGDLAQAVGVEDVDFAVAHADQALGLQVLEGAVDTGPRVPDQLGQAALAQVEHSVL